MNRKRVQRSMREMGIAGIVPGPNLSKRAAQHHRYPYLLRRVTATAPHAIWGSDLTYMRLRNGWLYLVVVLDWYARSGISWTLRETLELPFVLAAVDAALTVTTPTIWNSDQGSHSTRPQRTRKLEAAGAKISMDGRGRAHDTIFTARLWRSIKDEEV